jgi:hypothetical protein
LIRSARGWRRRIPALRILRITVKTDIATQNGTLNTHGQHWRQYLIRQQCCTVTHAPRRAGKKRGEAPYYSDRERAALEWTEAVTGGYRPGMFNDLHTA